MDWCGYVSAQYGEPALARKLVEGGLHHRAHVGVDLVDVGFLAELGEDVDGLEHLSNDLSRQRQIGGEEHSQAEWETDGKRHNLPPKALESQSLGQPSAAGQEKLGFLAADRHNGHDRHTGCNGGLDISGAAVEV